MNAVSSVPLLLLILIADFAITLLHSYQEWKGAGAPLWRNFGAIVGLDISDWWGFRIFTGWPRGRLCSGSADRRAAV